MSDIGSQTKNEPNRAREEAVDREAACPATQPLPDGRGSDHNRRSAATLPLVIGEQLSEHGVLCFGGEDWWYHNRGHCDMQFMRQYSKQARVVYVNSIMMRKLNLREGQMFWKRVARKGRSMRRALARVQPNFWVYSPISAPIHHIPLAGRLNRLALRMQVRLVAGSVGLRKPLVWVNCPAACDLALSQSRCGLVYQRTDRFEDYPGVDYQQVLDWDRRLKQHAELTFMSCRTLYDEERDQCRRAAYVEHGVDYDLFAGAERDAAVPEDMRELKRPIAGFFGGIDSHSFNLDLAIAVARSRPDYTFVFVGGMSIDCSELDRLPNVVMLGQKPYEQIPSYGQAFDVCLLPWNQNRWVAAANPIKIKEYLALGKPVIATPLPELGEFEGLIRVETESEGFAAAIDDELDKNNEKRSRERQQRVHAHSWNAKAEHVSALLFGNGTA